VRSLARSIGKYLPATPNGNPNPTAAANVSSSTKTIDPWLLTHESPVSNSKELCAWVEWDVAEWAGRVMVW
jgi:hypothetical protein